MNRKCLWRCFKFVNCLILFTFLLYLIQSKSANDEAHFVGRHLSQVEKNITFETSFQKIGTSNHKNYVFSAYYNISSESIASVIVIAGLRTNIGDNLYCQLYSAEGYHYTTIKAILKDIPADNENFGLPYVTFYIKCNFNYGIHELPTFVSILDLQSSEGEAPVSNLLRIKYNFNTPEHYTFSLCVQPTFSFEDPFKFMEWIEFYRLMGVEKFRFYDISIGPQTSCVIESYGELIEVVSWKLPYTEEEMRTNGQALAAHDCLWRFKEVSKYLIIADLDEMIVPSNANNYLEMISEIDSYFSESEVVGYLFRNVFFFTNWDSGTPLISSNSSIFDDKEVENVYSKLVTSTKIHHEEVVEKRSLPRMKYIVIPEKIVQLSIHYIVQMTGNAISVTVPYEIAKLHHYRNCLELMEYCNTTQKIIDNSAQIFSEKVATAVSRKLSSNSKLCNIDV